MCLFGVRVTVVGLIDETGRGGSSNYISRETLVEQVRSRRPRLDLPGLLFRSPDFGRGVSISCVGTSQLNSGSGALRKSLLVN